MLKDTAVAGHPLSILNTMPPKTGKIIDSVIKDHLYKLRHTTPYLITFDWAGSAREGVRVYIGDDISIDNELRFPDMFALIKYLDETYPGQRFLIVGESSWGSYVNVPLQVLRDKAKFRKFVDSERDKVIKAMRERGHEFRVYNPRVTRLVRDVLFPEEKAEKAQKAIERAERKARGEKLKRNGKSKKDKAAANKTNLNDSKVIYHIARNTDKDLLKPSLSTERDTDLEHRIMETNEVVNIIRYSKNKDKYSEGVVKFFNLRPFEKKIRGHNTEEDLYTKVWKDNGKSQYTYNALMLSTIAIVAAHALNERDFDNILGFRESARGRLTRANMENQRWPAIKAKGVTGTECTRELRTMYRLLRPKIKEFHQDFMENNN